LALPLLLTSSWLSQSESREDRSETPLSLQPDEGVGKGFVDAMVVPPAAPGIQQMLAAANSMQ
jgi:hypothetical protein